MSTMQGLRIDPLFRWSEHQGSYLPPPVEQGAPLFTFFFRSILDQLDRYYWITQQDSLYQVPAEWTDCSTYSAEEDRYVAGPLKDLDDLRTRSDGEYQCFGPGLMPRFAVCVADDWNELYGLREAVDDFEGWVERLHSQDRVRHVEETVEVCFLNIDGAYWELHARDETLVEAVGQDLQEVPGCRLTPLELGQSHGL